MTTQTAEITGVTTIQSLTRGIAALSDESIKKLADYIEDLIDEQSEIDDIAYIDARRDEPTIPFEEVLAKHEAKYAHLIRFKSSADKELDALQGQQCTRILRAIRNLGNNPRPPGCKKLKNRDAYRIRVGEYRIIYEIHDDVLIVLIVRVAHRRDAYK